MVCFLPFFFLVCVFCWFCLLLCYAYFIFADGKIYGNVIPFFRHGNIYDISMDVKGREAYFHPHLQNFDFFQYRFYKYFSIFKFTFCCYLNGFSYSSFSTPMMINDALADDSKSKSYVKTEWNELKKNFLLFVSDLKCFSEKVFKTIDDKLKHEKHSTNKCFANEWANQWTTTGECIWIAL